MALIGACDKIMISTPGPPYPTFLTIDYVIFSNYPPASYVTPWVPGYRYDLPVIMTQNQSLDIDDFMREWHAERWIEEGAPGTVTDLMYYFQPYWCGWGNWAWWWHSDDCIDIAVGAGESLDVEQITPLRVIMSDWPPPPPSP